MDDMTFCRNMLNCSIWFVFVITDYGEKWWCLITMIVISNHNHYSGSKQRRRSSSIVENDYEDAVDNAEEVEDDYEEEYDQKKQLLDGNDTFMSKSINAIIVRSGT